MRKKIIAGSVIGVVVLSIIIASFQGGGKKVAGVAATDGGKVAVVYLSGAMVASQSDSYWGGGAASNRVTDNLRKAAENPEIAAVVIRIDSPGGTPVAAQEISMEISRLQDTGKVVVASMGDTAASAAYWVAACTDKIVANPGTLTGSIGVIMETMNFQGLFEQYGIDMETIKSGPYKDIGSYSRPVTPEERAILQDLVDDIYGQFIEVVALGRGMEIDQVRQLADGRVFTGRQALELGLVDQMGDLHDAVALAGDLADIKGEPIVVDLGYGRDWWSFFSSSIENLIWGKNKPLFGFDARDHLFNIR